MVGVQRPNQRSPFGKTTSCCFENEPPSYGKYFNSYLDRTKKGNSNRAQQKPSAGNRHGCHGGHAENIRTKGPHQFYNMMWDPAIYRGNCLNSFTNVEASRCRRWKTDRRSRYDDADSLVKRRKFPRHQNKIGGIYLPKIEKTEQQEKVSLENMGIQTEEFLEELTSSTVKIDMCTQPDEPSTHMRSDYSLLFQPVSTGMSQSVQCNIGQAMFDTNVEPIKQELSRKILEQSLLETTEEAELEVIKKEKQQYMDLRREEIFKLKRFLVAQRTVAEERELALANEKSQELLAEEAEKRVGAALFSAKAMSGVMPIAFNVLQLERYLESTGASDMYQTMLPYLDREISSYYNLRTTVSRKLLDDLLQQVTDRREAEIAESMWIMKRDREPSIQNPPNTWVTSDKNRRRTLSLESMPFDTDFRINDE